MKFSGNGIVWNPEKGEKLAKFENGVFETDDKEVISKLKKRGYKKYVEPDEEEIIEDQKKESEEIPEKSTEPPSEFELLRAKAKDQKIKDYKTKTKKELEKLVK